MHSCQICNSDLVIKLDEISPTAIVKYYHESLGMDVSSIVKSDGETIIYYQCNNCSGRFYFPLLSGNSLFYENLQKKDWYYQDVKPEYIFASKFLKAGDKVLEIGCGKGAFAKFMPSDVEYRGLEFNNEAVKKGLSSGLRIDIESVEDHAMRYKGTYDYVCHFQVLEHVENVTLFLQACSALLKPGGLLLVAVPSEDSFLSLAEGHYLNMPPHHLTRWTDRAISCALERSGVDPIEYWHEPIASYHRDWYQHTMAMHAIRQFLGQSFKLSSIDMTSRIFRRILRLERIRSWLSRFGERNFIFSGRGHTVCVVGGKSAGSTLSSAVLDVGSSLASSNTLIA